MDLETQTDYLDHVYLQVKDRPLRDGELNLLPDDAESGFANTVRCVPEAKEGMYMSYTLGDETMLIIHAAELDYVDFSVYLRSHRHYRNDEKDAL